MASGFFALFDDIATLMDDVAVTSKVAAQKTAGVLGDDLAVNAEKASGFSASRELPVLWAISKGALINKFIILPFAFLLSAFLPGAIIPILLMGGIYLAYEGTEKIYDYLLHRHHKKTKIETTEVKEETEEEKLKKEKKKIKSAITTDFILSIEIIIIALSTVTEASLPVQIAVVSLVALLATIGVYGIVALIVRMDDFGFYLVTKGNSKKSLMRKLGQFLVTLLPWVIKSLSVIGTIAMLLVAGGIYVHNIEWIHHLIQGFPPILGELTVGFIVGILSLIVIESAKKAFNLSH